MRKTGLSFTKSRNRLLVSTPEVLAVADLPSHLDDWIIWCDMGGHSARTNGLRRIIVSKFIWFCGQNNFTTCGHSEVQRFFAYLNTGHESKQGRWGNPQQ